MLQYETVFIADPTYTDEEIDEIVKGYEQVIGSAKGKIIKIEKRKQADSASGADQAKKTVVIRRNGQEIEASDGEAEALASLATPAPLAEGQRIRVIRQMRKEETRTSAE